MCVSSFFMCVSVLLFRSRKLNVRHWIGFECDGEQCVCVCLYGMCLSTRALVRPVNTNACKCISCSWSWLQNSAQSGKKWKAVYNLCKIELQRTKLASIQREKAEGGERQSGQMCNGHNFMTKNNCKAASTAALSRKKMARTHTQTHAHQKYAELLRNR